MKSTTKRTARTGKTGDNSNRSWNCGAEGPTDDPAVNALGRRQQRNFLATLFLSQGVPMLCGGDEYGRSQQGNNKAYCQDNALSWFRWRRTREELAMTDFTARLIAFRRAHPTFNRTKFFHGRKARGAGVKDIMWLNPSGQQMSDEEWSAPFVKTIGMLLCGDALDVRDWHGQPITDETFLMLLNASHESVAFTLPNSTARQWATVIDTMDERGFPEPQIEFAAGKNLPLEGRAFVLLRRTS